MATYNGDAADSPPLKKKTKLPFKPTALRRTSIPAPSASPEDAKAREDDGLELFRRSREMAPIVAADTERRLKRKMKKDKDREERRRSSSSVNRRLQSTEDEDGIVEKSPASRRGSSSIVEPPQPSPLSSPPIDEDDDVFAPTGSATARADSARDLVTPPPSKRSRTDTGSEAMPSTEHYTLEGEESPSVRRLRSSTKKSPVNTFQDPGVGPSEPQQREIISLDSDDDEDVQMAPTPSKTRASVEIAEPPSPRLSPLAEDDPFEEHVRRAEAQRARYGQNSEGSKVIAEVLVTSEIPDGKPLRAMFTFDKPLKLVRDSWVSLQIKNQVPVDVPSGEEVVLTWRGNKVYNVDTLLSLGIRPQDNGRVSTIDDSSGGLRQLDGFSHGSTRVHMQAWTPAQFIEQQKEKELKRRREAGEYEDFDDEQNTQKEPTPPPEIKIKVTLRARDMDDVRLTARPGTSVETLITGFRKQTGLGNERKVILRFDGDVLEEYVTIDEAGVEDKDTIEVYFD